MCPPQTHHLLPELRPGGSLGAKPGREPGGTQPDKLDACPESSGLGKPTAAPQDLVLDPFRGSWVLPVHTPIAAGTIGDPSESPISPSQGNPQGGSGPKQCLVPEALCAQAGEGAACALCLPLMGGSQVEPQAGHMLLLYLDSCLFPGPQFS